MVARLLRPEHFRRGATRLTDAGLSYEEKIGPLQREVACLSLADTFGGVDDILDELAKRPPTRVVLNPKIPTAKALGLSLRSAQRRALPSETINVTHGLPAAYVREWGLRKIIVRCIGEGQKAVLVAFARRRVVGYFGLDLCITRDWEDRIVRVRFRGDLIYVRPEYRGKGYGIDLCVAACELARDVLEATYRAVPANWMLEAAVAADFESEGGEAITKDLHSALEYGMDMLREYGRRPSIKLGDVEFDAGW